MKTPFFTIDPRLTTLADRALTGGEAFQNIEEITEYNQQKVLAAFIEEKVSEPLFYPTTGYGYGDRGRETLDALFARIMGTEDALVRHSIVSGTHAITIALFGVLRPGDTLLAATGAPYDTLEQVIGMKRPSSGRCGNTASLTERWRCRRTAVRICRHCSGSWSRTRIFGWYIFSSSRGLQPAPLAVGGGYWADCGGGALPQFEGRCFRGQLLRRICGTGRAVGGRGRFDGRFPDQKSRRRCGGKRRLYLRSGGFGGTMFLPDDHAGIGTGSGSFSGA